MNNLNLKKINMFIYLASQQSSSADLYSSISCANLKYSVWGEAFEYKKSICVCIIYYLFMYVYMPKKKKIV